MKKPFKETRFGKLLGKIKIKKLAGQAVEVAADALPFGTTTLNAIKGIGKVAMTNFDKNGDGRLSMDEFPWVPFVVVVGIAVALGAGWVEREDLLFATDLLLKVLRALAG